MQILAGNTAMLVFAMAVILGSWCLAVQYESWSLPLAVILVVPMCLLCSLAGVAILKLQHEHLHYMSYKIECGYQAPLVLMRTKTGKGNQIRKTCIRERISLGGAVLVK